MKKIKTLLMIISLATSLGVVSAQAQDEEKPWSISFDNAFTSKYIWRGQNLSNTASMQPGIGFSYGGFSISSWSNVAHTAFGDSGIAGNHWTEHDLTLDYGFALNDKVSVNVGYINYAFPNFREGRYTNEVYGAISVDTIFAAELRRVWRYAQWRRHVLQLRRWPFGRCGQRRGFEPVGLARYQPRSMD